MKPEEAKLLDKIKNNKFGKYNGNEAKYVLELLDSENKKIKKCLGQEDWKRHSQKNGF